MATLKPQFEEKQRFDQVGLWLIFALIYLSPFIIKFNSILENGFWGTFSKGILAHIISLGMVAILLLIIRLKTKAREDGLYIQFFPFMQKQIDWKEIKEVQKVQYGFWDVRGWGIRLWTKYGTAYTIKGKEGVRISLQNGKRYLIGSQKNAELQEIIQQYTQSL